MPVPFTLISSQDCVAHAGYSLLLDYFVKLSPNINKINSNQGVFFYISARTQINVAQA